MTDYKATSERWQNIESAVEIASQSIQWVVSDEAVCLLELRARVEALEANSKPTPNPIQIRSSLVHRVAEAMSKEDWMNNGLDESACQSDDPTYRYTSQAIHDGLDVWSLQARAAIREVLYYLYEHELVGNYVWRQIEQELGR